MKNCKFCGRFESLEMLDTYPRGVCLKCLSEDIVPEFIPYEQKEKYLNILYDKRKNYEKRQE